MNAGMTALLMENLKTLKMSAIKRDLNACLRQAKQTTWDMMNCY